MSSRKALAALYAAAENFIQFDKPSARWLYVKWLVLQRAVADPTLTKTDLRLLARALDHFNGQTGRCDPAVATVAQTLDCTPEIVRKSARRLEKANWLDADFQAGHNFTNQYNPRFERFDEYFSFVVPRMKAGGRNSAGDFYDTPERTARGPRNGRSGKTGNESGSKKRATKKPLNM